MKIIVISILGIMAIFVIAYYFIMLNLEKLKCQERYAMLESMIDQYEINELNYARIKRQFVYVNSKHCNNSKYMKLFINFGIKYKDIITKKHPL
jgi:hypothetical protein